MFWDRILGEDEGVLRARLARRVHSRWLTRAMRQGVRMPRIPTRLESEGGFAPVMATTEGRAWAEQWWSDALAVPDPE